LKLFRNIRLFTLVFILVSAGFPQTRRDPRCVAMAGAYGAVSRGLFAVDYNPANLAFSNDYNSYRLWGGFDFSFSNNFISIKKYKEYNGQDFEAKGGKLKKKFISEIPERGWRIFADTHFALPFVNYSSGNKAFTSDIIVIGDIGLPRGLVRFIFEGNPYKEGDNYLDLDFNEEFLMMGQYAYSFAIPFKNFSIGFSLKYLQGFGYFGLNPDSSNGYIQTFFRIDKNYIIGEGKYLFQQSLGGRGFGLDIGVTSDEINGYRFGASLTNLFGKIYWQKKTLISRLMGGNEILPWNGDFYLYEFDIKEARFGKFFKNIPYDEIFSGEGKTIHDTTEFKVRYPSLVRFSMSKWINEDAILATDFVAGFEDRLYSFGAWKWCMGIEIIHSKEFPIRFGVAFGGKDNRELTFGSGYHKGFIHFDWAFGVSNGLWFTTAKGFNFSISAYTTGKRKD